MDFDESLSGLLDDGVEGTPFVGATIRIDRHKGLVVEIPYLLGTDNQQFEHVRRWFTSRKAPTNMELLTPEGCVSLFGINGGWNIVSRTDAQMRHRKVAAIGCSF